MKYFFVLSHEQALMVKHFRMSEGCTWRRVADKMAERYPGLDITPGDQIEGRELCLVASDYFDENWD